MKSKPHTGADVQAAYDYAVKTAIELGLEEQVNSDIFRIVEHDKSPGRFKHTKNQRTGITNRHQSSLEGGRKHAWQLSNLDEI